MLGRPQWGAGFRVSGGVSQLDLDGRRLLFSESSQEIRELNATAGLIWDGLVGGLTPAAVSGALAAGTIDAGRAEAFVDELLGQWISRGELYPGEVEAARGSAEAVVSFRAGGQSLTIGLSGERVRSDFEAVFGHLCAPARPDDAVDYLLVGADGLACLFQGERCLGAAPEDGSMPLLKAVLTEAVVNSLETGFAAHAACLLCDGGAWLLIGSPGAGKTTLCAALAARGFGFGSDDVTLIDGAGRVRGAPFALAVKSGAWPILQPYLPGLAAGRTWLRADGQQVKYVRPPGEPAHEARDLHAIVALARTAGAPARLEPADPADMLALLLGESYAPSRFLSADQFDAIGRAVAAAACRKLVYSDLSEAVELLSGFL